SGGTHGLGVLSVDAGGVTGSHTIEIDTTAGSGYYEAGETYYLVATAGTVDSVSMVGKAFFVFQLGPMGADVQAWNGGAVPTPAEAGAAMTLTEAYDAAKTAAPSAATVAGAVLDEALGAHDGWLTTLLTAAGYTAPANSDIATILEDTAALIERLTEARAGYLDLLNTYLDAAVSGAVAPTVEEINTKLETEHGAGSWGAQGAYTITPTTPLTDSVTGNPISGMTVKIYSNALRTETYLITEVKSDTEGSFTAHVTASGTYYLRAIKEGYTTIEWTEVAA
ncbi:MAG: hypothetical protein WC329_08435, partial [Candidatus Omnitrophota bacterium]